MVQEVNNESEGLVIMKKALIITGLCLFFLYIPVIMAQEVNTDPLPSWNDGVVKQNILKFVNNVTQASNPLFVPEEDRVA